MSFDLFSVFDYSFGVSGYFGVVLLWGFVGFFNLTNSYFMMSPSFHSLTSLSVRNQFKSDWAVNLISGLPGGVSLMVVIILILGVWNLFTIIPYSFGVSCHFSMAFSYSIPLWVSIFLCSIWSSSSQFLGSFVLSNMGAPLCVFLVFVEMLSMVIRAFTLSFRLCLNMMSGQVMMGFLGVYLSVFLVSDPSSILSTLLLSVACGVMFCLDLFVAFLQAILFVSLIVLYMDECTSIGG